MKNIFKILGASVLLLLVFSACKKEVSKITYEGGTEPVLSSSANLDNVVLDLANQANAAIGFSWTNPNYQLSTGLSSQNVSYTLQVDTLGAYFTNPKMAEISISNDQVLNLTVGELNDIIVSASRLSLKPNMPHNIQFRIKSTMVNETVPLYSNIIEIRGIVPYPDPNVPTLWITGSGTNAGWTNTPPPTQQFTYIQDLTFELIIDFAPGGQYKFLTKQAQWQPQWGGGGPSGGTLSVNPGGGTDPDAIDTPGVAGTYKITVDLTPSNPNFTVVLQ